MARAAAAVLVVAALVLFAAALAAGRVLEYQALEDGIEAAEAALAPLAAAWPPASSPDVVAADAGGVRDDRRERGGAIADVLWFVLEWANQAANGDRRKAY